MNKPSERIVVFVTPAQKRAISATADELGISVSELMRRAVIAFSATSDQVKAASIVDRLNARREPDALAQVLRKAARPLRAGRSGVRPAAQTQEDDAGEAHRVTPADTPQEEPALDQAEREMAQTVARLAAEAAQPQTDARNSHSDSLPDRLPTREGAPLPPLSNAPFARTQRLHGDEDASDGDPAPEGGKFA